MTGHSMRQLEQMGMDELALWFHEAAIILEEEEKARREAAEKG